MKNSVKRVLAGTLIAAGMAVGVGLAGPASAMPVGSAADPIRDGEAATCAVFDEDFTGNVVHDSAVALGVAKAQSEYYGISMMKAVEVTNAQVYSYCPRNWPNLVAIGNAARGSAGSNV